MTAADACWDDDWIDERDTEAFCTLPPGHPGKHWDELEGWEW